MPGNGKLPSELDTAITWLPDNKIPLAAQPIPLTMVYRYKRDSMGQIVKGRARCAVRGNKIIPYIHYDPKQTTTYMADKTTVRIFFAIAASPRQLIEHIDIEAA